MLNPNMAMKYEFWYFLEIKQNKTKKKQKQKQNKKQKPKKQTNKQTNKKENHDLSWACPLHSNLPEDSESNLFFYIAMLDMNA